MSSFFDRVFPRESRSAHKAKERMKLVLIHDRMDLSPSSIERMKDEIIEVITRHIPIDPKGMRIEMTQDGREQRLIADIPLKTARRARIG